MSNPSQSESPAPTLPAVDYLLIGHLSEDRTPDGITLGGTVCYSGLTAHVLGHSVGLITAASERVDLGPLDDLTLVVKPSPESTSFENIYTPEGRIQTIFSQAVSLVQEDIPPEWMNARLVHVAPLIGEFSSDILDSFQSSFIGLTPQGLMREWDSSGRISALTWEAASEFIRVADAVVVSIEDFNMDEEAAEDMATQCSVMVLTKGPGGARVWADGQVRSMPAPPANELDATGAGDVFAPAFFSRYHSLGDPWMAAETAIRLATASVGRSGLSGTPTPDEVQDALRREGS